MKESWNKEKYEREQIAEQQRKLAENQVQQDKAEGAAAQTPALGKKFVYRARTPEQWASRAQQGKRDRRWWRKRR